MSVATFPPTLIFAMRPGKTVIDFLLLLVHRIVYEIRQLLALVVPSHVPATWHVEAAIS